VHGVWPSDQIEHINRKRSDNRLVTLKSAEPPDSEQRKKRGGEKNAYFASLVAERKQRFGW
jgi:hypothetical protein